MPKSLIVWTGNPKPLTQGAGNIPNNFKGQSGSPNVGPTRKVEISLLFLPLHWKTFGVSQDVGLNNCMHQAIKTHWRSSRPQARAPALWCDHGAYCLRAARQLLHSVRRKADGKKQILTPRSFGDLRCSSASNFSSFNVGIANYKYNYY
ncbi:MAG: hypothetical protein NTY50_02860 [Methylobacter sp.]|nr:hypothetical protein [Methylobacter sp.]